MNAATQTTTTFKSYSEKSKAKRALKQVYNIEADATEAFLQQVDGKWGFYLSEDGAPVASANQEETQDASEETSADEQKASNAFGAFAMGQLGGAAVPQPSQSTTSTVRSSDTSTGRTIEKDRPEQNGVKRPSIGGLCRAVWDACDAMRTEHGTVTAKMVKAHAETQGWNTNNASIEFYQWRKFNGITSK